MMNPIMLVTHANVKPGTRMRQTLQKIYSQHSLLVTKLNTQTQLQLSLITHYFTVSNTNSTPNSQGEHLKACQ